MQIKPAEFARSLSFRIHGDPFSIPALVLISKEAPYMKIGKKELILVYKYLVPETSDEYIKRKVDELHDLCKKGHHFIDIDENDDFSFPEYSPE